MTCFGGFFRKKTYLEMIYFIAHHIILCYTDSVSAGERITKTSEHRDSYCSFPLRKATMAFLLRGIYESRNL